MTYDELKSFYRKSDRLVSMSINALNRMHGDKPEVYAAEILKFIEYKEIDSALEHYSRRVQQLNKLQSDFEIEKSYKQNSYNQVHHVDDEIYKLSLLLSFVITNHRFEILEHLVGFLKKQPNKNIRLLIIGFGTGYEVKLALEHCKNSEITAYDNSLASYNYATDLLGFYGYPADSLRMDTFPLEAVEGIEGFEGSFDKIVLCEVMEHLEKPEIALKNMKKALKKGGELFVTMAVNIAQEDHVYLYNSVDSARKQVSEAGFHIIEDSFTPVTILPFNEKDRFGVSDKGNYICVAAN